ncbi:MAG TPA: hypothetical protein VM344_02930 [Vitreimonas sp.]|nr:hypothetical protein [Vitreimonas sp.]
MAVRLQMKLGVVAEQDRLPDSPDTVVVVEPSVGSVARSKGHLYLLVTSRIPGHRAHEATRLAAETIRNEYYYDESAGIRVCIEKAIAIANKRLAHQRDRLGLGHGSDGGGPIGVGVAVVRGNELYVATVGPAEAYLIRQARLSTLPDPHRERGLPSPTVEPDVWRGEIAVGDSLVLISPNVVARLGPEELKDAMVTLHPQSAMEHLHHRFVAADGSGSDGSVAVEATEVAITHKQRTLVPVRPAEPLAGRPDRSPIPLADPVVGGVAAVQAGARQARSVAGNAFERSIMRLQDLLPQRRTAHRRVTPISARRETQRRAAVALLAFIVVAFGLGLAIFMAPRGADPGEVISSVSAGQRALDTAKANLARVFGPGVDLVERNPEQAHGLLTDAYAELDKAEQAGIAARTIRPIREDIVAGLDRLYRMVTVEDRVVFEFDPSLETAVDLVATVRGPEGVPYVLDRANKAVWRANLRERQATLVIREGTEAAGRVAAEPKFLTVGGPDVLILDANNVLWRWRPASDEGRGTLTVVRVTGAAEWGDDIVAIGTYLRDAERGLYNLYLIDPSLEQIRSYSPAADGGGFPAAANNWLNSQRDVSDVTGLYIDGDIYLADGGGVTRFSAGTADGWKPADPGDDLLRDKPAYRSLTSITPRREGRIYLHDPDNQRILAFDKSDRNGAFLEQYRLPAGNEAWADLRSMYVVLGIDDAPPTIVWIDKDRIHFSRLTAVSVEPSPAPRSPAPTNEPTASAPAAAAP